MNKQDLTLLTDLYELTMMQGYYVKGQNEKVIFDVFFRANPCNNGYSVCAGLDQVCLLYTSILLKAPGLPWVYNNSLP